MTSLTGGSEMVDNPGNLAVWIAQIILVALFGGGAGAGGWLAWRAKRRADKAKVAASTEVATDEHRRDTRKELRLMSDYCHELRAQVSDLGGKPEDWPDTLRHLI